MVFLEEVCCDRILLVFDLFPKWQVLPFCFLFQKKLLKVKLYANFFAYTHFIKKPPLLARWRLNLFMLRMNFLFLSANFMTMLQSKLPVQHGASAMVFIFMIFHNFKFFGFFKTFFFFRSWGSKP